MNESIEERIILDLRYNDVVQRYECVAIDNHTQEILVKVSQVNRDWIMSNCRLEVEDLLKEWPACQEKIPSENTWPLMKQVLVASCGRLSLQDRLV